MASSRQEEEEEAKRKREENVDFLYAILKVDRTASLTEIQNSYKRLTRAVHPDKIQQQQQQQQERAQSQDDDKEHAENCFVLVKHAHDVLTDPIYRFAYNHGGLLAVELVKRSQQVDATRRAAVAAATRRKRESSSSSYASSSKNADTDDGGAHLEDELFDDSDNDDDDENYYNENHPNLYKRLEYAKSKEDAIQIIENLLDEYHLHIWASKQAPLEASVDFHQAYHHHDELDYDNSNDNNNDIIMWWWSRLQSEATSSMSLSTQRSMSKQMDCSCSWNGHVDRSGAADFSTRLCIGYRPRPTGAVDNAENGGGNNTGGDGDAEAAAAAAAAAASTFYAMDITLNQGASYMAALQRQRQERLQQKQQSQGNRQQQQQEQQRPPLHLVFQTSRRFHDKTLVQVAVGGSSMRSLQSWSYSLSSSRLIVLGSFSNMFRNSNNNDKEQDDVHLHASWQAAFSLARPTSVHALAGTVRNLTFPQYKVRLSPLSLFLVSAGSNNNNNAAAASAAMSSSPALKLTMDSAASHAWHFAIAWHWWLWRIKVTKEQPLSRLFSWKTSSAKQRHAAANNPDEPDEKPHHDDWLIKYGFRFDFHEWITMGALGNSRNHWGLLLQLHSAANDAWNIRIPIDILQYNTVNAAGTIMPSIVSTWIAFLLGQWLEEFIESTFLFEFQQNARHKNKPATCLSTTPRAVQEKATTALLSSNTDTRLLHRHHHHHAMASPPPRYVETIRQVAAKKRQLEKEKPNDKGLVILQATIWRSPSSSSSASRGSSGYYYYLDEDSHYLRQEDVTDLLQFWVVDSRLPRLCLWNASLSRYHHYHHYQRGGDQWWRDWLLCHNNTDMNVVGDDKEHRQKSYVQQLQDKVMQYYASYLVPLLVQPPGDINNNNNNVNSDPKDNSKTVMAATIMPAAATARLYIRYQYEGKVYEIEFSAPAQDCQQENHVPNDDHDDDNATTIWLPHPHAVIMGSASRVQ